jgi:CheY-like chemotaxis protein
MAIYRVLIVDNQRRDRQASRLLLESLGPDFKIRDASSGEEALLILAQEPVDLLISEYRLAGMSGEELMHKVRQSRPGVKTIFVSAASHTKIRKQAMEAGAEECFFKPLDHAQFLAAVGRCLGLSPTQPVPQPPTSPEAIPGASEASALPPLGLSTPPPATIPDASEILARLHRELDAASVALLEEDGKVAASIGELPGRAAGASMYPALAALLGAGARISMAMGKTAPQNFLYFSGAEFDLFVAHIEHSRALVVLTDPASPPDKREMIARRLAEATLALQGKQPVAVPPVSPPQPAAPAEESAPPKAAEPDPRLDALLKRARRELQTDELNLFWDTAAEHSFNEALPKAGVLTYDQARQLGLTPKEEP